MKLFSLLKNLFHSKKKVGWVNLYHGRNGIMTGNTVFNSKEEAESKTWDYNDLTRSLYLATARVEWEE